MTIFEVCQTTLPSFLHDDWNIDLIFPGDVRKTLSLDELHNHFAPEHGFIATHCHVPLLVVVTEINPNTRDRTVYYKNNPLIERCPLPW